MRGGIRPRGKNRWELMIYLGRAPDGKKIYRWHRVTGSRADAQRELTRLLNSVNTGTYVGLTKLTLAEYLERWMRDYAKAHVARTTYQRYDQIVVSISSQVSGTSGSRDFSPMISSRSTRKQERRGGRHHEAARSHQRLSYRSTGYCAALSGML